ncbi:IS3 family transposase, partial [Vibrio sp. 10N.222.54.B11]|uniref:IS3 family transposase n=1 Tax=Vibrio sp. 10N.222.54.B11 TaxID=3229635 RepID=UPI00354D9A7F
VQYEPIMTREDMRQALFEYIEVNYYRTRRHRALEYLSPVNFLSLSKPVSLTSVEHPYQIGKHLFI